MEHLRSGLVAAAAGIVVWFAASIALDERGWSLVNIAGVLAVVSAVVVYAAMVVLKRRHARSTPSGRRARSSRRR